MSGELFVQGDLDKTGYIDVTLFAEDNNGVESETFTLTDGYINRVQTSILGNEYWIEVDIFGSVTVEEIWFKDELDKITAPLTIQGNLSENSTIKVFADGELSDVFNPSPDVDQYNVEFPRAPNRRYIEAHLANGDTIQSIEIEETDDETVAFGGKPTADASPLLSTTRISFPELTESNAGPLESDGNSITATAEITSSSASSIEGRSDVKITPEITESEGRPLLVDDIWRETTSPVDKGLGQGLPLRQQKARKTTATGSGIEAFNRLRVIAELDVRSDLLVNALLPNETDDISVTAKQQISSEETVTGSISNLSTGTNITEINGFVDDPENPIWFQTNIQGQAQLDYVDVLFRGRAKTQIESISKTPRTSIRASKRFGPRKALAFPKQPTPIIGIKVSDLPRATAFPLEGGWDFGAFPSTAETTTLEASITELTTANVIESANARSLIWRPKFVTTSKHITTADGTPDLDFGFSETFIDTGSITEADGIPFKLPNAEFQQFTSDTLEAGTFTETFIETGQVQTSSADDLDIRIDSITFSPDIQSSIGLPLEGDILSASNVDVTTANARPIDITSRVGFGDITSVNATPINLFPDISETAVDAQITPSVVDTLEGTWVQVGFKPTASASPLLGEEVSEITRVQGRPITPLSNKLDTNVIALAQSTGTGILPGIDLTSTVPQLTTFTDTTLQSRSSLTHIGTKTSFTDTTLTSRSSLTHVGTVTGSIGTPLSGALTIFGEKTLAEVDPLLGSGPIFIDIQTAEATPLDAEIIPIAEVEPTLAEGDSVLPNISLTTTPKITESSGIGVEPGISLTEELDVTKANATTLFNSTSLTTTVPEITRSEAETLFEATSIATSKLITESIGIPIEGTQIALPDITTATATPLEAGTLGDGGITGAAATPLEPRTKIETSGFKTKCLSTPVEPRISLVTADVIQDSDGNPQLDFISLLADPRITEANATTQEPRIDLVESIDPTEAKADTFEGFYKALLDVQQASAFPLEATLLNITSATARSLVPTTGITEDIDATQSNTTPLTTFLSGDLISSPGIPTANTTPLELKIQSVISTPITPTLVSGSGVLPNPSLVTNVPDLTKSTADPVEGKYIAIGDKAKATADPLLGIYVKGIPSTVEASPLDARGSEIITADQITLSHADPLQGQIGGDVVILGSIEDAFASPLEGFGTDLHRTTAPFDILQSSSADPRELILTDVTVDPFPTPGIASDIDVRTSIVTAEHITLAEARPRSERTAIPQTINANPLTAEFLTILGDKTSAVGQPLTPKVSQIFLRSPDLTNVNATPLFKRAFPHTPTPDITKANTTTLQADGIVHVPVEGAITEVQGLPILAFSGDSLGLGDITKAETRMIDAARSMITHAETRDLVPELERRLSAGNAFITSSNTFPIQVRPDTARVIPGEITSVRADFPIDYVETRSDTRRYSISYSIIENQSYPDNLTNDKTHRTDSNSTSSSTPNPEIDVQAPEFWDVRSQYLSERSTLRSLEDSASQQIPRYWIDGGEDDPSGFVNPYEDHLDVVASQRSFVENLKNEMLSLIPTNTYRTPEQKVIPTDSSTSTTYAVSKTTAKNDVITAIDRDKLKTQSSADPKWAYRSLGIDPMVRPEVNPLNGVQITAVFQQFSITPVASRADIVSNVGLRLSTLASRTSEDGSYYQGGNIEYDEEEDTNFPTNTPAILITSETHEMFLSGQLISTPFSTPKAEVDTFTAQKKPVTEADSRPLIPIVEFEGTTGEVTECISRFPVDGRSSIPDGEHDPPKLYQERENRTATEVSETTETADLHLGVQIRSLNNDIETIFSGEGTTSESGITATGGASTDWVSGTFENPIKIPEGKWEVLPTSNQPFPERLRWGWPEIGTGLDFTLDVDETDGVFRRDFPSRGVSFEVTGEPRVIEGSVGIKDRFHTATNVTDTDSTDYYIWSKTHAFSEMDAEGEITYQKFTPVTYYGRWNIDGEFFFELNELQTTWKDITINFDVTKEEFNEFIDVYRRNSGKFDEVARSTGGFRTIDRSSGGASFRLNPPSDLMFLRYPMDVIIDDVSASEKVNDWEAFEVEMRLMRSKDKSPGALFPQHQGDGDWTFNFSNGIIETDHVTVETSRNSRDNIKEAEIELILDKFQTKTLEESGSFLNSVDVEDPPDGDRIIRDYTEDDHSVLHIESPSDTMMIEEGEYVIEDWEVEWITEDLHRATIDVMKR